MGQGWYEDSGIDFRRGSEATDIRSIFGRHPSAHLISSGLPNSALIFRVGTSWFPSVMPGPEPHPWKSTACWKVGGGTSVKNLTVDSQLEPTSAAISYNDLMVSNKVFSLCWNTRSSHSKYKFSLCWNTHSRGVLNIHKSSGWSTLLKNLNHLVEEHAWIIWLKMLRLQERSC